MLARRTLVIEAVVGAPTTTRTPQPPKRGHDPVQHDGTPSLRLAYPQFIGPRYLVTVHGPVNPAVPPEAAVRETRAVLGRIEAGRLRPGSPSELSYAVVSALAEGQEAFVETITWEVWPLEQRVTSGQLGDPEQFMEELFGARHGLLAVSNMATLGHQLDRRMSVLGRFIPPGRQPLVADLEDQVAGVSGVADGQVRYLEGVIEFYRARTDTKVTIAAERLALIAVITLPITAVSSLTACEAAQ